MISLWLMGLMYPWTLIRLVGVSVGSGAWAKSLGSVRISLKLPAGVTTVALCSKLMSIVVTQVVVNQLIILGFLRISVQMLIATLRMIRPVPLLALVGQTIRLSSALKLSVYIHDTCMCFM